MSEDDYDRRPLDDVLEAGPPANPLNFPPPKYDRGRRVERVLVNCPVSDEILEARNVLFLVTGTGRNDEDLLQNVDIAYWKVPDKKRIKIHFGYIEICHVLKRCQEDLSSSDSDSDSYSDASDEKDITFEMTDDIVAVKSHSWNLVRQWHGQHAENPLNEISAMQLLGTNHPNVMGCKEVLFDGTFLNVIMPYCNGGDLLQRLSSHKHMNPTANGLPEREARFWFKQLLDGISHFQKTGICHRDLSPENIMIDEQSRSLIIDMGMCLRIPFSDPFSDDPDAVTVVENGELRRLILPQQPCGKLRYMCPEIFMNKDPFDGYAVDMWTAGTILLFMLTGTAYKQPFDPFFKCITKDLPRLLREFKIPISPLACHLIQNLLLIDPRMRITLEEALEHPWFDAI